MVEQAEKQLLAEYLDIETIQSKKEGLERLKDYFDGKRPFCEVHSFLIDSVLGSENSGYQAYVGKVRGKQIQLKITQDMQQVFRTGGSILATPKEDEFYKWIDFLSVDQNGYIIPPIPLASCKVDYGVRKFNFISWYGSENQLFLDYLGGQLNIDPSRLRSFRAGVIRGVKSLNRIAIGYVNNTSVDTLVVKSHLTEIGSEVIMKPRQDSVKDYSWVEGYASNKDGEEQLVCSRRFFRGEKRLYPWKGPEVQTFIDWVLGKLSFDEVNPLTVIPDNQSLMIVLEGSQQNNITINLKDHSLIPGVDSVILVPTKDNLYEWIEIHKAQDSDQNNNLPIASFRVKREGKRKLDGTWPGPVKQRYIDFLDNKLDIAALDPLHCTVGANKYIYLFRYRGKPVQLGLKNIGSLFTPGEVTTVTPSVTNEQFVVTVTGQSQQCEVFVVNRNNLKINSSKPLRNLKTPKPEGYWTIDKVVKEANEFYKSQGDISQSLLAKAGRQDLVSAIRDIVGGMIPLKERLGVTLHKKVSSEDADGALGRLIS